MLWLVWTLFISFILALLALDLGIFHRHPHVVSLKESLTWSAIWISLGLLFSLFIYFSYQHQLLGLGQHPTHPHPGRSAAIKYLTGYLVEESLSLDNIVVIALLFSYFAVPRLYQHRVLFWGILGAQLMRGIMIAAGASLISRFHWILYLFGLFLLATSLKMLLSHNSHPDPSKNPFLRLIRRLFPITQHFHGQHFFIRAGYNWSQTPSTPDSPPTPDPAVDLAPKGAWMLTPLGVTLIMIEITDLLFAVDSIPAIFSITSDPFLVFSSNIFAILGLRSLYFALESALQSLRYLKPALALILALVGLKMLTTPLLKPLLGHHLDTYLLLTILLILTTATTASLLTPPKKA